MDPGLRTSATGMIAQQKMVDVIANNLANVNTTGFKRSRAAFEDVLYETVQGPRGAANESVMGPMQIGRGVRLAAVTRIDTQGGPQETGRPFDVAILGDGFFQVMLPDGGTAYTRDGSFTVSDSGQIVNSSGQALAPGIVIPADASMVEIEQDGTVAVLSSDQKDRIEIGKLELARFVNPTGLTSLGNNLLGETPASGSPIIGFPGEEGFGRVLQGNLETSNVEVVLEMTDMIAAQRAYEINARALKTAEEMMQSVDDLLR